jgi:hydroxymethylglutaryl-CoA synthase
VVTDKLEQRRTLAPATQDYINRRTQIDYAEYTRYRDKINMG